ncbi:class I SAM-dependent methyltransferase [Sphaerisporangium dianthi]|uniref:Class I SAM-dependent methyltransferase n=1 Tax=Sphaerisporangium dianthi TaxID=1436120 RepID=A0ABV9CWA9_9ACTN
MNSIVNTHQAEAWNGYEGNHWADNHDRYDAVNSGFNEHLLRAAAIGEHDRVLDVGCGNGQFTRLAARRARLGRATGLDLSTPMLQRARALAAAEGVGNVTFEQGDAQVHPFAADAYDVAVSRFGVMFFADPVTAFANIGRALRPGGRVAFLVLQSMDRNDLGRIFAAMRPHLDPPGGPEESPRPEEFPRPGGPAGPEKSRGSEDSGGSAGAEGPGPDSLAAPARVRQLFDAAGFAEVACTPVEAPQVWGRDTEDAAAFLEAWGPVRHWLGQVDAAAGARARLALAEALAPFERDGAVLLRGAGLLITATRP